LLAAGDGLPEVEVDEPPVPDVPTGGVGVDEPPPPPQPDTTAQQISGTTKRFIPIPLPIRPKCVAG
jgi:hypothetical protein